MSVLRPIAFALLVQALSSQPDDGARIAGRVVHRNSSAPIIGARVILDAFHEAGLFFQPWPVDRTQHARIAEIRLPGPRAQMGGDATRLLKNAA